MELDPVVEKAIMVWLLFPVIGIPVSLAAWKTGNHDFLARLFVWFVIIPFFLFASYLGGWFFFSLLAGCCIAACFELMWLDGISSDRMTRLIMSLSISLPWLLWAQLDMRFPWQHVLPVIIISMLLCFWKPIAAGPRAHIICLSLVMGSNLCYWLLLQKIYGFRFVLFAFTVVVITDIMAFVPGKMLGGPRLFPQLSPGKTLAGFVGGGVSAVLVSYIFWFALAELSFLQITTAGILLAVSGSAGDLLASFVKRFYCVKDFSRMLGPMGGVLDRLDSMLCSGWLFWFYIQIFVKKGI